MLLQSHVPEAVLGLRLKGLAHAVQVSMTEHASSYWNEQDHHEKEKGLGVGRAVQLPRFAARSLLSVLQALKPQLSPLIRYQIVLEHKNAWFSRSLHVSREAMQQKFSYSGERPSIDISTSLPASSAVKPHTPSIVPHRTDLRRQTCSQRAFSQRASAQQFVS